MFKNYVAYTRVSTQKQDYGLTSQLNEINAYIEKKQGKLLATFTEKESGKNNNRTELKLAIEYCKKHNATLIVSKLDRLSRSVKFIMDLHDSKLDFVVVDNPNLTTLTIGIYSTIAQHELELISARTKAGLKIARSKGKTIGRAKGVNLNDNHRSNIGDSMVLAHKQKKQNIIQFLNKNIKIHNLNINIVVELLNANNYRTSKNNSFTKRSVKPLMLMLT